MRSKSKCQSYKAAVVIRVHAQETFTLPTDTLSLLSSNVLGFGATSVQLTECAVHDLIMKRFKDK